METSTRIVKNTTYLYIKMAANLLISLYTARVFLNTLGPSDYGLYTLIAGVIFMFGFLQDTLSRSTLRYLCFYKAQNNLLLQKKVYTISIILHLIISLIIAFNLIIITDYLFSGFLNIDTDRVYAARMVYYFMIASFAFTVMSVPYDSILNANEDMLYYSVIGIIESVLRLVLAIWLPFVETDKLIFYSFFLACITIFSLIIKRVYCHRKYEECQLSISLFDKGIAKQMTTYAGWNFLTSITSLISFNAMPVLLNNFFNTVVNAAQGIAGQVNGILMVFSSNLLKALNPTITKSGGVYDIQKTLRFSMTGSKLSFLITCFLSVPIIVECHYILKLWLVNVPEWAPVFCALLLIRSLSNQLVTVYAECIYASDNIRNYCIIKGILNILPIVIVYLWFKMGAAPYVIYIALFLCWELLGGIVIIYYNRKLYHLSIASYLRQLVLPCLGILVVALAMGFAINTLFDESIIRLFSNILLSCLIISLLSWVMVLDREEKDLFVKMLGKLLSQLKITHST